MPKSRAKKRWILGMGFDHRDGHKRFTRGENFLLLGGSHDTHVEMQEKVIRLNEKIRKKKRDLDTIAAHELSEIAQEVGLYPLRKNLPES